MHCAQEVARGRTADQDVPVVARVILMEKRAARRQRHPAHRMRQLQLQRLRQLRSERHLADAEADLLMIIPSVSLTTRCLGIVNVNAFMQ